MFTRLRFALIFSTLLLAGTSGAHAALEVCNRTDATLSVAIGYNDEGIWTSEGWWVVDADVCATVVDGDLDKNYYYWHAAYNGGTLPDEGYTFCTTSTVFTIVGDTECEERGYETTGFSEAEMNGATDYTIHMTASSGSQPPPDPDPNPDISSEPPPVADLAAIRAGMQGNWQAEEDVQLQMVIQGNQMTATLNGDPLEPATFTVAAGCVASRGIGPVILVKAAGESGVGDCWFIGELNADRMLLYIISTDTPMAFERP